MLFGYARVSTADQAALAQQPYDARTKTVPQIADLFGVPRSTVYGHLTKDSVGVRPMRTRVASPGSGMAFERQGQ